MTHDTLVGREVSWIGFVNPMYKDKIPSSAVLQSRRRSICDEAEGAVMGHLQTNLGMIHLTLDGVTDRYFVDQQWRHQKRLLALPALFRQNTGDDPADEAADMLAGWGPGSN
jgi:hypothetical protein